MTTPATAPTLTLTTDKTSYVVGDTITLTAAYSDVAAGAPVQLTVTATGTDSAGNTVTATTTVPVTAQASQSMEVTATDSFGDAYTLVSNDGKSTAVLTATIGAPPAAA